MKKITLLLALFFFSVARAGLFDDDEARRAIIDVRKKIEIQIQLYILNIYFYKLNHNF